MIMCIWIELHKYSENCKIYAALKKITKICVISEV